MEPKPRIDEQGEPVCAGAECPLHAEASNQFIYGTENPCWGAFNTRKPAWKNGTCCIPGLRAQRDEAREKACDAESIDDCALHMESCRICKHAERIAALEAELAEATGRAELAEHDRDDARGERDRASQEVQRLMKGIEAAMDYASHRWSEWGSRALNVAEILDATLEGREPELE